MLSPTKHLPSLNNLGNWLATPPNPRDWLPRLPYLLAKPVTIAPFFIQSTMIKQLITPFFGSLIQSPQAERLQGKWIRLHVNDLDLSFVMASDHQQRLKLKAKGQADVTISGALKSFVLLAAQQEDPDTLFFQRDLLIEGDTDLGLFIKNLLDAFDWNTLPPELIFMMKTAAEYMKLFSVGKTPSHF